MVLRFHRQYILLSYYYLYGTLNYPFPLPFQPKHRPKVLLASVAINVLTNPLLNLYLNCIDGGWTSIGVGEVVVVVVEAVCYYLLLRRIDTAIIYSLLCNAISFLTGCLVLLLAALV